MNVQLKLFDLVVLEHAELISDSPKKAFWNIRLEHENETFSVVKVSGIGDIVLDRRRWRHKSYDKALKDYGRRLRAKLNPTRKSPRRYKIIDEENV